MYCCRVLCAVIVVWSLGRAQRNMNLLSPPLRRPEVYKMQTREDLENMARRHQEVEIEKQKKQKLAEKLRLTRGVIDSSSSIQSKHFKEPKTRRRHVNSRLTTNSKKGKNEFNEWKKSGLKHLSSEVRKYNPQAKNDTIKVDYDYADGRFSSWNKTKNQRKAKKIKAISHKKAYDELLRKHVSSSDEDVYDDQYEDKDDDDKDSDSGNDSDRESGSESGSESDSDSGSESSSDIDTDSKGLVSVTSEVRKILPDSHIFDGNDFRSKRKVKSSEKISESHVFDARYYRSSGDVDDDDDNDDDEDKDDDDYYYNDDDNDAVGGGDGGGDGDGANADEYGMKSVKSSESLKKTKLSQKNKLKSNKKPRADGETDKYRMKSVEPKANLKKEKKRLQRKTTGKTKIRMKLSERKQGDNNSSKGKAAKRAGRNVVVEHSTAPEQKTKQSIFTDKNIPKAKTIETKAPIKILTTIRFESTVKFESIKTSKSQGENTDTRPYAKVKSTKLPAGETSTTAKMRTKRKLVRYGKPIPRYTTPEREFHSVMCSSQEKIPSIDPVLSTFGLSDNIYDRESVLPRSSEQSHLMILDARCPICKNKTMVYDYNEISSYLSRGKYPEKIVNPFSSIRNQIFINRLSEQNSGSSDLIINPLEKVNHSTKRESLSKSFNSIIKREVKVKSRTKRKATLEDSNSISVLDIKVKCRTKKEAPSEYSNSINVQGKKVKSSIAKKVTSESSNSIVGSKENVKLHIHSKEERTLDSSSPILKPEAKVESRTKKKAPSEYSKLINVQGIKVKSSITKKVTSESSNSIVVKNKKTQSLTKKKASQVSPNSIIGPEEKVKRNIEERRKLYSSSSILEPEVKVKSRIKKKALSEYSNLINVQGKKVKSAKNVRRESSNSIPQKMVHSLTKKSEEYSNSIVGSKEKVKLKIHTKEKEIDSSNLIFKPEVKIKSRTKKKASSESSNPIIMSEKKIRSHTKQKLTSESSNSISWSESEVKSGTKEKRISQSHDNEHSLQYSYGGILSSSKLKLKYPEKIINPFSRNENEIFIKNSSEIDITDFTSISQKSAEHNSFRSMFPDKTTAGILIPRVENTGTTRLVRKRKTTPPTHKYEIHLDTTEVSISRAHYPKLILDPRHSTQEDLGSQLLFDKSYLSIESTSSESDSSKVYLNSISSYVSRSKRNIISNITATKTRSTNRTTKPAHNTYAKSKQPKNSSKKTGRRYDNFPASVADYIHQRNLNNKLNLSKETTRPAYNAHAENKPPKSSSNKTGPRYDTFSASVLDEILEDGEYLDDKDSKSYEEESDLEDVDEEYDSDKDSYQDDNSTVSNVITGQNASEYDFEYSDLERQAKEYIPKREKRKGRGDNKKNQERMVKTKPTPNLSNNKLKEIIRFREYGLNKPPDEGRLNTGEIVALRAKLQRAQMKKGLQVKYKEEGKDEERETDKDRKRIKTKDKESSYERDIKRRDSSKQEKEYNERGRRDRFGERDGPRRDDRGDRRSGKDDRRGRDRGDDRWGRDRYDDRRGRDRYDDRRGRGRYDDRRDRDRDDDRRGRDRDDDRRGRDRDDDRRGRDRYDDRRGRNRYDDRRGRDRYDDRRGRNRYDDRRGRNRYDDRRGRDRYDDRRGRNRYDDRRGRDRYDDRRGRDRYDDRRGRDRYDDRRRGGRDDNGWIRGRGRVFEEKGARKAAKIIRNEYQGPSGFGKSPPKRREKLMNNEKYEKRQSDKEDSKPKKFTNSQEQEVKEYLDKKRQDIVGGQQKKVSTKSRETKFKPKKNLRKKEKKKKENKVKDRAKRKHEKRERAKKGKRKEKK